MDAFNAQAGNENGTKVAMMLFSGPQYWSSYYRCLGQRLMPGEIVDMKVECGMDWVEHLTDDTSGAVVLIPSLVSTVGVDPCGIQVLRAPGPGALGKCKGDALRSVIRLPSVPSRRQQFLTVGMCMKRSAPKLAKEKCQPKGSNGTLDR